MGPAANNAGERHTRPLGGVRHCDATRHCRCRYADRFGRRRRPYLIPPLAVRASFANWAVAGGAREGRRDGSPIHAWHRSNELSRRLETIPGIGPITASAIAATVTDASLFKSGRQLAAWIGLVPRQNSSGGKDRLGRISKQGDPYLRRLLVVGAHAVLRFSRKAWRGSSGR